MTDTENPVVRRQTLLREGVDERLIRRMVHTGLLHRLSCGVYEWPDKVGDTWHRDLHALLARCGPGAVVSHRSAARLLALDGFDAETAIDISCPHQTSPLGARVTRSRTLNPSDHVLIGGFPVTSAARTIATLGSFVGTDTVELALESWLRGNDPKRPDLWKVDEYTRICAEVERLQGRAGSRVADLVLQRRPPNCRPTGSAAETKTLQQLRSVGLGGVHRQPTIRFLLANGAIAHCFFPDFGALERLFLIETNGLGPRGGAAMTERDLWRREILDTVFRTVVVTGPNAQSRFTATSVRDRHDRQPLVTFPCVVGGYRIERTAEGLDVISTAG